MCGVWKHDFILPMTEIYNRWTYSEILHFDSLLQDSCVDLEFYFIYFLCCKWKGLTFFYFRKVVQRAQNICAIYGNGSIAESSVCKWFTRYRSRNFDLYNREPSGRAANVDDDQIEMLKNFRKIIQITGHSTYLWITVVRHSNLSTWIRELLQYFGSSEFNENIYWTSTICSKAAKKIDPFLKRTTTDIKMDYLQ